MIVENVKPADSKTMRFYTNATLVPAKSSEDEARNAKIYKWSLAGNSIEKIAKETGLSKARAHQIISKLASKDWHENYCDENGYIPVHLSGWATRALREENILYLEQLEDCHMVDFLKKPFVGMKTITEITEACEKNGVKAIKVPPKNSNECPHCGKRAR